MCGVLIQLFHLIMPTDREKREISKKAMAKKEEKEKIKKLKQQGLCIYEGEIIPVMEARKGGGHKGGNFGYLGRESGEKGKKYGEMGKEYGEMGKEYGEMGKEYAEMAKEYGVMGKEYGVMGKEDGVKGKEFGILGADDGVSGGKFGKLCPKESQFLGQVTSMVLCIEKASEKYDTPGEAPIQVNI